MMPPMLRSLVLASFAIKTSLAKQAGLRQAVSPNSEPCHLREWARRRLLLIDHRAGTRRRPLEDVREEPELLVRRHGLLVPVLPRRVQLGLLQLLLLAADCQSGVDILQLLLLLLLPKPSHLRTERAETLPKLGLLASGLLAELAVTSAQLTKALADVGSLSRCGKTCLRPRLSHAGKLAGSGLPEAARGGSDVGKLAGPLPSFGHTLQAELTLGCPDVRQLSSPLQCLSHTLQAKLANISGRSLLALLRLFKGLLRTSRGRLKTLLPQVGGGLCLLVQNVSANFRLDQS